MAIKVAVGRSIGLQMLKINRADIEKLPVRNVSTAAMSAIDKQAKVPIIGCTWASSDEAVATVDVFGVVTGETAGDATITGTYGVHTATLAVTVVADADQASTYLLVPSTQQQTVPEATG